MDPDIFDTRGALSQCFNFVDQLAFLRNIRSKTHIYGPVISANRTVREFFYQLYLNLSSQQQIVDCFLRFRSSLKMIQSNSVTNDIYRVIYRYPMNMNNQVVQT